MSQIKLKRLLSKKRNFMTSLIEDLQTNPDVIGIEDASGNLLFGISDDTAVKHPIVTDGEILGWVIGGSTADLTARLLIRLINQEAENSALSDDTLELYREINLLYSLSERLTATLDVHVVARTALEEAGRLIQSTDGFLILIHEYLSKLETVASFGQSDLESLLLSLDDDILLRITSEEKAEIINNVRSNKHFVGNQLPFDSIAYAPMRGRQRVIGMIVLINRRPVPYTARDAKLLNTIATQTAPALENVLFHKKSLEEAREREDRLQKQIRELRLELDEARQEKQVAEITESDYFQKLSSQADDLRKLMTE